MRHVYIGIGFLCCFLHTFCQESLDSAKHASIEFQLGPYLFSNLNSTDFNYEFEILLTHNTINNKLSLGLGYMKLNSLRIPEENSTREERHYFNFSLLYGQKANITRSLSENIRFGFDASFPIVLKSHGLITGWYGSPGPIDFNEDVGPGLHFRMQLLFNNSDRTNRLCWGFAPFVKYRILDYLREFSSESTPEDFTYAIGMRLNFETKVDN